jgi:YD repeat-containing protein
MLAYMMLISPVCLQSLAEGADRYSDLDSRHWVQGDTTIEYGYDDNGSLTSKVSKESGVEFERTIYEYNLQNRLALVKVSTDGGSTWDSTTTYKYDPDGNRVEKIVDGTSTTYLVDSQNLTGYSQVFVETTGANKTSYIIGDDILAQATGNGQTDIQYLLYDGHGSIRQLSDSTGNLITNESYSYDAYGVMLGGDIRLC